MVDTTTSSTVWSSTAYNVADQPTTVTPVAGDGEGFQYDVHSGRMTQWASTAGSNTQTGNLIWNANGTLQSLVISDNSDSQNNQMCTYGYDDLERLLSANCGTSWSQTFSYDQFGNIWKYGSSTFNQGYGSGNRVTGFSYDGMSNVTNDGANSYTYDAEGRPINSVATATFDPFLRETELGYQGPLGGWTYQETVYAPDGTKFAIMNGTILNKYMVPMAAGMAAVHPSTGSGYFQHADWLGSSRFGSTGSGTVAYDRAYAPFGKVYAETAFTNRNFTGQTQDTTSGLYDFLFRQQSTAQGRWLVPDPAGLAAVDLTNPQTWNRYAYLANYPLNNIDPLGLYKGKCGDEEKLLGCLWGGYTDAGAMMTWGSGSLAPTLYWNDGWHCCQGGGIGAGFSFFPGGGGGIFYINFKTFRLGRPATFPHNGPVAPNNGQCTGVARGLAGATNLVGHQGGIPGQTVQLGTAAVIPQQFGFPSGAALAPYAPYISGTVGNASFSGVTDVIGGKSPFPPIPVRTALQLLNPGKVIIEIPGAGDQGLGNAPYTIFVPQGMGCPTGNLVGGGG